MNVKKKIKSLKYLHIPSKILLLLIALVAIKNIILFFSFNNRIQELSNVKNGENSVANVARTDVQRLKKEFEDYTLKQDNVNSYLDKKLDLVSFSMFTDFGVVGDSHASGSISVDGGPLTERMELSWGQILSRRNGNTCVNFSIGGCTTDSWLKETNTRGLKLLKETEPLSLYILGLGINDAYSGGDEYLGNINDIDKEDYRKNANSFYGNYARIISEIKLHSPHAKIIMMTIANNNEDEVVSKYNDAIMEIADICDVPCIHLHENNFFISDFYKDNFKSDHPTAVLYSGMAVSIEEMIEEQMVKNIDYFEDYIG